MGIRRWQATGSVRDHLGVDGAVTHIALDSLSPCELAYWDACIADNPGLTPFHSRPWLTAWAEAYDETSQSFVLVYRDAKEEIGGLLPMMRWDGEVRSLSYNATDYTGMCWLGNGRPAAVGFTRELVAMAQEQPVRLWNLRPVDPLAATLTARRSVELISRSHASAIRLSDARLRPWRQVSPTSEKDLARRRQRLIDAGMRVWYGSRIDETALAELVAVHTRRWQSIGQGGNFADPRRVSLVQRLMTSGVRLFFALLYVDDRVVSYRFGPIDDSTYYDWNTGTDPTDPALRRLSPGLVLLDQIVGRLYLSERVRRIDFLRGEEDYKRAWQTEDTWVSEYRLLPDVDGPLRLN
jgi:CelD/BcsL family acetyltransferase involved in cellulose biosynthesis